LRTIADLRTLDELIARFGRLRPDSPRRWGTLTPAEMLCHLGDAHEWVLGIRVPPGAPPSGRRRPFFKWIALYTPIPWPHGVQTRPGLDPRLEGTRPGAFEADRLRAIRSLGRIAAASPAALSPSHTLFGPMTARDWHRWAWRHVHHHLRQFGL
jgi:DinB superfamily